MPRLFVQEDSNYQYRKIKREIINTYANPIVRLYCFIRFLIIPLRMMDSIGQFLPNKNYVLDLGCGFGLFLLYFAKTHPETNFIGIDISSKRISYARHSAEKLGLTNVDFRVGNAVDFSVEHTGQFATVISIDLFHHLNFQDGDALAKCIYQDLLQSDGTWILKDVTTRPRFMLYFTYLLDLLMNPFDSFYYRNSSVWRRLSCSLGYKNVQIHEVWDVLPYPHFLLVARKSQQE